MAILSSEKSSRKRKRSNIADDLLSEEQTLSKGKDKAEKQFEIASPEQKSAKKRKKDRLSNSFSEKDTQQLEETEKTENSTKSKSAKKEKVKKKQEKNSTPSPNNTKKDKKKHSAVQEDSNQSDIDPEPKKKKGKRQSSLSVVDSKLLEKSGVETKKNKKKPSAVREGNNKSDMDSEPKKKKNKNEKSKPSFGVVDSKLLEKSGVNVNNDSKSGGSSRVNRAVDYLHLWKKDRKSWKFNKNFQTLLIKAAYNPIIITEDDFETLLLYLEECKGFAREKLRTTAMALIKEEEDHLAEPVDADMERRARQILQMLG